MNPEGLLNQIITGDENTLRQLFEQYSQRLYHVAYYYLQAKEPAEEAVLDVFTTVWKKRESLGHIKTIEQYLYTSTKNQALHYLRRNYSPDKTYVSLYEVELIPESNDPESLMEDNEYELLIQEAINSLPPKCKEVFRLVLSDKLKNREIAELLSISESTVNEHIALAYKRITLYVKKRYK